MGRYVESALVKDEKITYTAIVSLWSLIPDFAAGSLFFLMGFAAKSMFILSIIIWLAAYLRYKNIELAITNKRVIAKFGIIARNTIELNICKIESIQIQQNILGRLFNYGSLIVSGAGNPQAPIPSIANPMNFRKLFMETQEEATQAKPT